MTIKPNLVLILTLSLTSALSQPTPVIPGSPGTPAPPQALNQGPPAGISGEVYSHTDSQGAQGGGGGRFHQRLNTIVARANPPEPTFNFQFEGGPAELFVEVLSEALNKETKSPPNILVAPGMGDMEIPAFKLRNITLQDLFQALNTLDSAGKKGIWQPSGANEKIWILNPAGSSHPFSQPHPYAPQVVQVEKQRRTMVYPVGALLTKFKIEDLTTAIQTALGMMGGAENAQLKFHQDTELLLAVGDDSQLRVVEQVLTSIERGQKTAASAKQNPEKVAAPEGKPKPL